MAVRRGYADLLSTYEHPGKVDLRHANADSATQPDSLGFGPLGRSLRRNLYLSRARARDSGRL